MAVAARKYEEFEESYRKYGVDMRPAQPQVNRPKEKAEAVIRPQDKFRLLVLMVVLGVLCIGIILATAYAAQLKYDINSIISENDILTGEIQNLEVEIGKEANIATIEQKATEELGMVYPMNVRIIYIENDIPVAADFAMMLKDRAFN